MIITKHIEIMKSLQLKKVKISKVNNIIAGNQQNQQQLPPTQSIIGDTCTTDGEKSNNNDTICTDNTNTGTLRTELVNNLDSINTIKSILCNNTIGG